MNQVFVNSADRLFMRIKPFTGKYAVKEAGFFEQVGKRQDACMPNDWVYRPLTAEIEITNKCNQACPHCGMASNGMKGISYGISELEALFQQIYDIGIPSYAITGGEPFVELENMLAIMERFRGKLDVCKITTNGFWGYKAEDYLDKLCQCGLLDNRYFVPCFMLSIGEQTTPMDDICNIIHYISNNFSKEEITICISSLCEYGDRGKKELLIDTYRKLYGEIPSNRLFLTENFYRSSSCMEQIPKDITGRNVGTFLTGPLRCFEPTVGRFVLPHMLVKATGDVCTCGTFNPPKQLQFGNIRKMSLKEILQEINHNEFVRIIAEDGMRNFRHWIPSQEWDKIPCGNECEACGYLINAYIEFKQSGGNRC